MVTIDIIPDIHGHAGKLYKALGNLGWYVKNNSWRHAELDRQVVFLGDFIDRGQENAATIEIVRGLMDAGRARAVMGNHELNALHLHTIDPDTGVSLRKRSPKNLAQHRSFLDEFPFDTPQTRDVLNWFATLPIFIEDETFRVAHAYWSKKSFAVLNPQLDAGRLNEEQVLRSGRKGDPFEDHVKQFTNGPEVCLPDGYAFNDKDGNKRDSIRLKWWQSGAKTYRDIGASVPDINLLPDVPISDAVSECFYGADEKKLFFGHYWMSGQPHVQAANAICLDYSVGSGGPLVTYELDSENMQLDSSCIHLHT